MRTRKKDELNIYVCFDGKVKKCDNPSLARIAESDGVNNDELRRQKETCRNLLCFAIADALRKAAESVEFTVTEYGKRKADGFEFSASHTDGAVVVAIGDLPCGVDVERISRFNRIVEDGKTDAFNEKTGARAFGAIGLAKAWTAKESVYKARGYGAFRPSEINTDDANVIYAVAGDFLIAVACKTPFRANFYEVANGARRRLKYENKAGL